MKPGGGKRKGGAFERKIAKDLSKWFTGKDEVIFWRTHSSGSLGTISKMKGEYGDLMAIRDEGKPLMDKFNVELRHAKSLRLIDLLYHVKSSYIIDFIKEGLANAKASSRYPLWVCREQVRPILVMMLTPDIHVWCAPCPELIQVDVSAEVGCDGQMHRLVSVMLYEDWKKHFSKYMLGVENENT